MRYLKNFFKLVTTVLICFYYHDVAGQDFVHPGLLQNAGDLARITQAVSQHQEPIYEAFNQFKSSPESQYTYQMLGPLAIVGRNPTVGQNIYDTDAAAAYQNAIMWSITRDKRYAAKAEEIINAWSATLKSITGRDAVLMAGLGPFKMVNAAEILRYTDAGWAKPDVEQAERNFMEVIYPVIENYALFANGNWDTAAMKTAMAIGVFCNNRAVFEKALVYYVSGAGNGALSNYIINDAGQCQESGRDQQHTQLGIAHLADCSEIAWHQGLDLYGYDDNLLLKGFEYTAEYNLGYDVSYRPVIDKTGKYLHQQISPEGRGRFRTIYEQVYNHYVNRLGLAAPYTQQVAEKLRPEKQGSGGDNIGFGTLLYTRSLYTVGANEKTVEKPAVPAGLVARTSANGEIVLSWVPVVGAEYYTVKRSLSSGGPFKVIAKGVRLPGYNDGKVQSGKTYFYAISSKNKAGLSEESYPVGMTSGLPDNWRLTAFDSVKNGYASYNSHCFTISGEGGTFNIGDDQLHFLYHSLAGNGSISARYLPPLSSQSSIFGLHMRNELTSNAADIFLVIVPESSGQIEAPAWTCKLLIRSHPSEAINVIASTPLQGQPFVTFSRLTGCIWLNLQRKDNEFYGYFSVDGQQWTTVGSVESGLASHYYAGISVASGLNLLSTSISFDNVNLVTAPPGTVTPATVPLSK